MPLDPSPVVTVVGVEADGALSLAGFAAVQGAALVVGGERHLALLPDVAGQRRLPWPRPFDLTPVLEHPGCVVVASGDPLLSGVATTLVRRLGADRVEVLPALSSATLARARMGWSAEETVVVSLTSQQPALVLRELSPGRRVLVLCADRDTPGRVAALLDEQGWGGSQLTALGDLGTAGETRTEATAAAWDADTSDLVVLAVEARGAAGLGWTPGLPDDAFEHDGQLTKRDLRASALARLAPQPGQLLWDVGAGAGSIGIEWLRTHPTCTAYAVERDAERGARVLRNAHRLGVPGVRLVEGAAPDALAGLPDPDAIFVGGGATAEGLLDVCRGRLRPGGRLVVHGVTLETERLLGDACTAHGGELTRQSVETAGPIGGFTGWTPARSVTQWAWTKDGPA